MISKKVEEALNQQINAEIWSAYLYLSMSGYLESLNLPGFAHWMKIQWKEELSHALKMFDFVHERGGRVTLKPIEAVPSDWKSVTEVFQETLNHERHVTSLIHNVVNIAIEERDHSSNNMLQWFVAEQVEEEATAENILEQVKMINGQGYGMLMLDRELGSRVFVDATQTA